MTRFRVALASVLITSSVKSISIIEEVLKAVSSSEEEEEGSGS